MFSLYLSTLKNTFNYQDPATRKEWFNFLLITFILHISISWFGFNPDNYLPAQSIIESPDVAVMSRINLFQAGYFILMLPTTLSIVIRRIKDTGKTKLYLLVLFIPLLGPILLLFFLSMVKPSDNFNKI